MFRMLVLQSLYNLSDEQVEYQVSDRMSCTRFLRLGIDGRVPDGATPAPISSTTPAPSPPNPLGSGWG
jgi:hypothetical protein